MQQVSPWGGLLRADLELGAMRVSPRPTPVPPAAYCRQIAPNDFQNFYYPNITKSGLTCVSNCSANTASAMDCNEGQCQLTPSGPQCL